MVGHNCNNEDGGGDLPLTVVRFQAPEINVKTDEIVPDVINTSQSDIIIDEAMTLGESA